MPKLRVYLAAMGADVYSPVGYRHMGVMPHYLF